MRWGFWWSISRQRQSVTTASSWIPFPLLIQFLRLYPPFPRQSRLRISLPPRPAPLAARYTVLDGKESIWSKGSADGLTDAVVTVPGEVDSYLKSGEMVALLCSTAARADAYPDVPTASELGFDLSAGVWTGICAPAGVDPEIVAFLSDAIFTVLQKDNVVEAINNIGSTVSYLNASDFDAMLTKEYGSMTATLKDLGLVG